MFLALFGLLLRLKNMLYFFSQWGVHTFLFLSRCFPYIELVLSCCLEPRFFGFCALMKAFLSSIAVATVGEKDKIRGQNVKIAGKRTTQNEFSDKRKIKPENLNTKI